MRRRTRLLAAEVGGEVEHFFGLAIILHGRLHVLNHRIGVPGAV
jgi:hypothetical protein